MKAFVTVGEASSTIGNKHSTRWSRTWDKSSGTRSDPH
jgi:hypothetical protein